MQKVFVFILSFLILVFSSAFAQSQIDIKINVSIEHPVAQQGTQTTCTVNMINLGKGLAYLNLTIIADEGILIATKYNPAFKNVQFITFKEDYRLYYLDTNQSWEEKLTIFVKNNAPVGKHTLAILISKYFEGYTSATSISFNVTGLAYVSITQQTISEAQTKIDLAVKKVNAAKDANVDISTEEGLLQDAYRGLSDARQAFDQNNYENAILKANDASSLAQTIEQRVNARVAIKAANNTIVSFKPTFEQGLNASNPTLKLFESAKAHLANAYLAFSNKEYSVAVSEANRAKDMAELAMMSTQIAQVAEKPTTEVKETKVIPKTESESEQKYKISFENKDFIIFSLIGLICAALVGTTWILRNRRVKPKIFFKPEPVIEKKLSGEELLGEFKAKRKEKSLVLEILETRFKQGEISKEEYEERANILKEDIKKLEQFYLEKIPESGGYN
ncbi:MAG: hypothetical protein HY929_03090 [Euryarchaeota archaeon]|nr:hypothetical protein [Euryarchaeota archaeon]